MKRLLLLLALIVAPAASAQRDVRMDVTAERATARTGERFTATITVRNRNATSVSDVSMQFGFTRGTLVFTVQAPAGWTCTPAPTFNVVCSTPTLAAGAEALITASLLTPNGTEERILAAGSVRWTPPGLPAHTSGGELGMLVTASSTRADLSGEASGPRVVREGETAIVTVDVRNDGPDAAGTVWLRVDDDVTATGAGWNCVRGATTLCYRTSLGAGQSAPVTLRIETPREPSFQSVSTHVLAENLFDPAFLNNYGSLGISVGNAERYEKILLPLTTGTAPGANGSLWVTTMSVVIDSPTRIELFPLPCFVCINIPLPPLNRPFDPAGYSLVPSFRSDPSGFFLYTHRGDAAKLRFNIRTQDTSRALQTWGTEIPAVREQDVRTSRIVLLDVPVGDTFRHTLRVYDFDGVVGAQVAIHVHGINGGDPIATLTRTLATREEVSTSARLPQYPAYVAFDSRELPAFQNAERFWYSVEPLTPGLRIWAYATVTNNATQHVTTITPQ